MVEEVTPSSEDQERWELERLQSNIGSVISALPETTIDIETAKGPRQITVSKKLAFKGKSYIEGGSDRWLPDVYTSFVEVKEGDKTLVSIEYTPAHQILHGPTDGGGYFPGDANAELEIKTGDTHLLHHGSLQKGLSPEALQPLIALLDIAKKQQEEKKQREGDKVKEDFDAQVKRSRDLLDGLI